MGIKILVSNFTIRFFLHRDFLSEKSQDRRQIKRKFVLFISNTIPLFRGRDVHCELRLYAGDSLQTRRETIAEKTQTNPELSFILQTSGKLDTTRASPFCSWLGSFLIFLRVLTIILSAPPSPPFIVYISPSSLSSPFGIVSLICFAFIALKSVRNYYC